MQYSIGKYAKNGYEATITKFKVKPLNESTTRGFEKLYKENKKDAAKEKCDPKKALAVMPRGRPLLLGSLDQIFQRFLMATCNKGGPISRNTTLATAKPPIARNPQ